METVWKVASWVLPAGRERNESSEDRVCSERTIVTGWMTEGVVGKDACASNSPAAAIVSLNVEIRGQSGSVKETEVINLQPRR